jgi:hypothetical protein
VLSVENPLELANFTFLAHIMASEK